MNTSLLTVIIFYNWLYETKFSFGHLFLLIAPVNYCATDLSPRRNQWHSGNNWLNLWQTFVFFTIPTQVNAMIFGRILQFFVLLMATKNLWQNFVYSVAENNLWQFVLCIICGIMYYWFCIICGSLIWIICGGKPAHASAIVLSPQSAAPKNNRTYL